MKIIRKWLDHQKEKSRKERREAIMKEFDVKEIGKEFFITHNNVAIVQIMPDETSCQISEKLNNIRHVALIYDDLKKSEL